MQIGKVKGQQFNKLELGVIVLISVKYELCNQGVFEGNEWILSWTILSFEMWLSSKKVPKSSSEIPLTSRLDSNERLGRHCRNLCQNITECTTRTKIS